MLIEFQQESGMGKSAWYHKYPGFIESEELQNVRGNIDKVLDIYQN
jgi:hypothetical protein